ncbi:MAG: hypothetical protein LH654_00145 [Thermoleophilia bacterium]|nr:hypothetical protein [Thermoleophilia bacterium]
MSDRRTPHTHGVHGRGRVTTVILFDGDRVEHLNDLGDRAARLRGSMLLWIDLDDLSEAQVHRVAAEFHLDVPPRRRDGGEASELGWRRVLP